LDHVAGAVGAAVVVWFASALPWGLSRVWEQSVAYNSGAGPRYAKLSQLRKLTSTLTSRDLLVVGAVLLALGAALASSRWLGARLGDGRAFVPRRSDVATVATWSGVTALVLILEPALYRNHLATIVPPLAILAAILMRTPRALVVLLVVLVPFSIANLHDILAPTGYRGATAAMMRALEALPRDAQVISDDHRFIYPPPLPTPNLL